MRSRRHRAINKAKEERFWSDMDKALDELKTVRVKEEEEKTTNQNKTTTTYKFKY